MCELLTAKEAREVLRVSEATMARWLKEGRIAYSKPGGKILIERSEIERLLTAAKVEASSQ